MSALISRRHSLFLLAAPAIVRAASLMPVSAKLLLPKEREWRIVAIMTGNAVMGCDPDKYCVSRDSDQLLLVKSVAAGELKIGQIVTSSALDFAAGYV